MLIKSSTATLVTVFCLIGLARCASIGKDKMAKAQSLGFPIITDKAAAESDYDLQAINASIDDQLNTGILEAVVGPRKGSGKSNSGTMSNPGTNSEED
ncbi:hypothetical protein MFLAVUS_003715 [Mucor flavus]|uniref:Uncharacterized protein n=1 Tax=Mucor flavus TaxID=439312 RepID=A0ABP9YTX5_9FUNG